MRFASILARGESLVLAFLIAGCAQGGGTNRPHDAGHHVDPDSGLLPLQDAGTVGGHDAGTTRPDAGPLVRDSGPPPHDSGPIGCTGAADCDDHLACNGVERCELGTCMPGTPPACDDGIACTRNRCLEPTSGTAPQCDYVPDDALCPSGQSCGPSGCSSTCADSPCRLVSPQCGCSAGLGCYLSGTTRVCAAGGASPEGSTCANVNDCSPGLLCLNIAIAGSAVNECGRFCATDADCRGAGSLCIHTLSDGAGGSIPGVSVCSLDCDPITQSGCVSGSSCQIYQESSGSMRFFTDCAAPVGAGGQGATCTDSTNCQRGFGCVGSPGTCQRYCDEPATIAGGGCSASEACYGFTTPLVIGGIEYGVCDAYP